MQQQKKDISLQKESESQSKVIPTSFLKIEGRGRLLGRKIGERRTVSRIGRCSAPPTNKRRRERREQMNDRQRSDREK